MQASVTDLLEIIASPLSAKETSTMMVRSFLGISWGNDPRYYETTVDVCPYSMVCSSTSIHSLRTRWDTWQPRQ